MDRWNRTLLLASVVSLGWISVSLAAPITATYDFVATFNSGPNPIISGSVKLTYDPTAAGPIQVDSFSSAVLAQYVPVEGRDNNTVSVVVIGNGCSTIGCGVVQGFNQFFQDFQVDGVGNVTFSDALVYSPLSADATYRSSTDTVTRQASPVSEPASLGLMITSLLVSTLVVIRKRGQGKQ